RLQPAQLDDEGVCQEFIPLVLDCLCSKEHKLRLMASRALPVVVDSSSLEKCLAYVKEVLFCLPSIDAKHGALMGMSALLESTLSYGRQRAGGHDSAVVEEICRLLRKESNAGLACEGFEALRALGAGDIVRAKAAREFLALGFKDTSITPAARAIKAAAQTLVSVGLRTRNIEAIKCAMGNCHDSKVAAVKSLKKLLSNFDDLGDEEE
ncbi:hypothetical protein TrCOL_g11642, partial [Triparma columacea]